jgi:phospholipase C
MTSIDRRALLRGAAGVGLSTVFPDAIKQALAIPANAVTGTIQDVQHIVVLMQENRSFDHYFGTLRGVRGFNDPRAVRLYGSGNSVFQQPNVNSSGVTQTPATLLPFRPAGADLGLAFLADLAHSWKDAHGAWNNGLYDKWIPNKTSKTMSYLQRSDIPYYFSLADAFTVCDAYHCSIMASTDPNRYYLWSGWAGQNGTLTPDGSATGSTPGNVALASNGNGVPPYGPVVTNAEAGYNWRTYPERLQNAGVSWKIYQDIGVGLTADGYWGWTGQPYIGNYGDNSLLYFTQYQNSTPGQPLYDRARSGTNIYNNGAFNNGGLFDQLRSDVMNNTLPQVSWIAAPEAYTEHPNWPTNYGAWYVNNVLAALTANPAVWASTVLIICYDENDGFFDHVVPPTPPMTAAQGKSTVSTVNEIYPGNGTASYPAGPYGLGARVPMLVVSPWSKGGWVNSQVFDHTSIVQFIEKRFGVMEPNISPWRRTVCGDLSSALDFSIASATASRLPSTAAYVPPASDVTSGKTYPNLAVTPPANQTMPSQEPGARLARALPYQLQALGVANAAGQSFGISFSNTGSAGAWFHVRTANGTVAGGSTGPWSYTVEAGKSLADTWTPAAGTSAYDLSVYGPNGFFRKFAGGTGASAAKLTVQTVYDTIGGGISLVVTNIGTVSTSVTVTDQYMKNASHQTVAPGASFRSDWTLQTSSRWYDLVVTASTDASFVCQCAGHVETGKHGVSDPLL